MRFLLTDEQEAFARSLDAMLSASDTPAVARAWAAGAPGPGRELFTRLGEAGVFALAAPESYEGVGLLTVELTVAFVELGRHAVPGPLVETVAAAVLLAGLAESGDTAAAKRLLPSLAAGDTLATLTLPGGGRYALDADAAEAVLVVEGEGSPDGGTGPGAGPGGTGPGAGPGGTGPAEGPGDTGPEAGPDPGGAPDETGGPVPGVGAGGPGPTGSGDGPDGPGGDSPVGARTLLRLAPGHGTPRVSADPVRRIALPAPGGEILAEGPHLERAAIAAGRVARLATAAQSLGTGLALLDRTVAYARQRSQFGAPIGAFQAVKHRLADTLLGLEFARPLLYGAAVTMDPVDIAAAKAATGEAAYAAARTALQLHGAVGYTEELDLALWLRKARPLRDAWGTPAVCRSAVLDGTQ
ncbi:acyl-CoA dehydrogenase family protein [Streptomyces sp. NPDC051018]|uniref:acyl-CoA dehydrogenase family protein n=1 Tax=Streptomyces sp. NPDC051018 TaxID=3365639 RepID=UPI0037BAB175